MLASVSAADAALEHVGARQKVALLALRAPPDVPRPPRVLLLSQRADVVELAGQGPEKAVAEGLGALEAGLFQGRVPRAAAAVGELSEAGEAVAYSYSGRCLAREGELVARHVHVLEQSRWGKHVQ